MYPALPYLILGRMFLLKVLEYPLII